MNYNLLISEINKIQIEYRDRLIKLLPLLNTEALKPALEEINIFWESNVETIELYLYYYARVQNTYVFTASTYLDVENKDYLPFLLLGDTHIFDDPLSKYALSLVQGVPITKGLLGQVKLTAEDNIKIINVCHNNVLVLPLRLMNQLVEDTVLISAAEQYFCSLFEGIITIGDYINQCNTFQDISSRLKESAKKYILFSEKDNHSLSFEQRYMEAKRSESSKLVDNITDGKIFFSLVFGPIQQAIDVLLSCLEYECVPFVRYKVAFHYLIMLSETFINVEGFENIDTIKYKACIAHLIYNTFDNEQTKNNTVDEFTRIIKKEDFENNLFKILIEENQSKDTYTLKSTRNVIEKYLGDFYIKLK